MAAKTQDLLTRQREAALQAQRVRLAGFQALDPPAN
jgi:hypothetical protein